MWVSKITSDTPLTDYHSLSVKLDCYFVTLEVENKKNKIDINFKKWLKSLWFASNLEVKGKDLNQRL